MSKRKDLTGMVFDELTVVEMLYNYQNKHRTYCKCIGIDGNEYIIRQDALVSGATHTIHGACNSGIKNNIKGQRFGRLVAIEPTKDVASNGSIIWKCLCDCGNYIFVTSSTLKRGHTTSCGCAKQDYINSTKIDIIGNKYGKLLVLEETSERKGNKRSFKCQCECGNIHICTLNDLQTGHTMSCGCKFKSKGEFLIEQILNELSIEYIKQKRFDNCKNIRSLPFDFYLPKMHVCIEYDGEQHFKPIDYWGGEIRFKERQKLDNIKTNYCDKNGIKLIRIQYFLTKEEIYNILNNLTNPATITA